MKFLHLGQGEYVAALVILGLLVSMITLLVEWQYAIHRKAENAIRDIEHSKELLTVIKGQSYVRIINEWGHVSTIIALIFKFGTLEELKNALLALKTIHSNISLFVSRKSLLAIAILPKGSWVEIPPATSIVLNSSIDPAIPILTRYARTTCVYTLYGNTFCNTTSIILSQQQSSLQRNVLIFNGTSNLLNRFAVLNFTSAIPISFAYPLLQPSIAIPPKIPVVILDDFKMLPRFLVETLVEIKILVNFTCRSVLCSWTPSNFTIYVSAIPMKPSYICLFDIGLGSLIGCSNGDEPIVTSSRVLLALVDGIPVYVNVYQKPYTVNIAYISIGGISNGNYTLANASVTTISFRGSHVVGVLYANYEWRLCRFTAWSSWGLCSNDFIYTVYDQSLYFGIARYGFVDLPLTVLNKTTPKLYPPLAPAPPTSSKTISIIEYVSGYVPTAITVYLRDFGDGYAVVAGVESVRAAFDSDSAKLRVIVPRYLLVDRSSGESIWYLAPLMTFNVTNVYRVSGYVIDTASNATYLVSAIEDVSGKTYSGSDYAHSYFDLGLNAPVSSTYVYTLEMYVRNVNSNLISAAILRWPLGTYYYPIAAA